MNWINKDTEIYCSFAKQAGNTGCQMMNSAFYYYGLNKIYKSFSVDNIEDAINSVKTLGIKGFAITMPYKIEVLDYVDELDDSVKKIKSANTVINDNGKLIAYNTDYYAAKTMLSEINFLNGYPKIFILGNGGYSKAVQQAVKDLNLDYTLITRDNWDTIDDIRNSVVYNCTPISVDINEYNTYINSDVKSETGLRLATLQASKQFELYTGLKFPLGD
jgi:shikimate dehydrogenase|tara:strand:+ start:994 stop:1647 length:654 start_codon:yes stop_codon:yes gene_type:complete